MKPTSFLKSRLDILIFLLLFVASLGLYLRTIAPTVLSADSGELQFASYVLGIVHPTGYPLYLLLGKFFTLLPVGDIAFRVNLMSAFWASLAIGFTYLTCLRLVAPPLNGITRIAAFLASVALATSATFWSQATIAEVYSLNTFLIVLLLWLLLGMDRDNPEAGRLLPAAGLILGLGLAHHRTIVLFVPAIILFLILALRLPTRKSDINKGDIGLGVWALSVFFILVPIFLYLYIPLRAGASEYLHIDLSPGQQLVLYDNTFNGFIRQVTGSGFAGELGSGLRNGLGPRLLSFGNLFLDQFGPFALVLSLLGAILLLLRKPARFFLLSGGFAGLLAFALLYGIGDIQDFLTPLYLIVALCISTGLVAPIVFGERYPGAVSKVLLIIVGGALLVSMPGTRNFTPNDRSQRWGERQKWEEILKSPIEPGAVLASNDRDEMVPLWYFQQVEGTRKDIIGLFPNITTAPEHANIIRLLDYTLTSGRPVYLIKQLPEVALKFRIESQGGLVKVVESYAGSTPTDELSVRFSDKLLLRGYNLGETTTQHKETYRPGEHLSFTLFWETLEPTQADYSIFVHLLDSQQRLVTQQDIRLGGLVYPTSKWEKGERLVSQHTLSLPVDITKGKHIITLGLYDPQTLKRLDTSSGSNSLTPFSIIVD